MAQKNFSTKSVILTNKTDNEIELSSEIDNTIARMLFQPVKDGLFANNFKALVTKLMEAVLEKQMDDFLNAKKSSRTNERKGYRNGTYMRTLMTVFGRLHIQVPRDRKGEFNTDMFERYSREDKAFCSIIMEMYLSGVSTRLVSNITEILCGSKLSRSTVSNINKQLDPIVKEFKTRPIVGTHKFVHLDGMYIRVREENKVVKKAVLIALGYDSFDGRKTVLGYEIVKAETTEDYLAFLEGLKDKGLKDPELFISDAHKSIQCAINEVYPASQWQYCSSHVFRKTLNYTAKKYKAEVAKELKGIKKCSAYENGLLKAIDNINNAYSILFESKQTKAMGALMNNAVNMLTYFNYPSTIHKYIYTNNAIERLNEEIRKREKIIKIFPNMDSANRLIGAILMRIDEKYCSGNRNLEMATFLSR